ncbi:DNA/RNA non-specific endonuclease [Streptomyces sp. NPDC008150]|uniref:DNA/RNA non-specific endonuclease n=1 Tax=Streptomyces sp. NPDC008150 TaxID=3364816 RepID=UPI0036E57E5F
MPLYAAVNTPLMAGYENAIAKRVQESGETIYYQVIPHYQGSSGIPDSVTLSWSGNMGPSGSKTLANVP